MYSFSRSFHTSPFEASSFSPILQSTGYRSATVVVAFPRLGARLADWLSICPHFVSIWATQFFWEQPLFEKFQHSIIFFILRDIVPPLWLWPSNAPFQTSWSADKQLVGPYVCIFCTIELCSSFCGYPILKICTYLGWNISASIPSCQTSGCRPVTGAVFFQSAFSNLLDARSETWVSTCRYNMNCAVLLRTSLIPNPN